MLDSGIGGIGVLRELKKALPGESFLYFGDSANAPYGEKTAEEILKIVFSRAARLACRAKALVLACNTATAAAAKELRAKLPIPVIGMEPAVRPALRVCPHPRVLVLATKYVSVGSIAAAAACPLFAAYYFLYVTFAPAAWVCTTVAALTVVWAHRGNIERLRAGNERRIGQKDKEA